MQSKVLTDVSFYSEKLFERYLRCIFSNQETTNFSLIEVEGGIIKLCSFYSSWKSKFY